MKSGAEGTVGERGGGFVWEMNAAAPRALLQCATHHFVGFPRLSIRIKLRGEM